MGDLEEKLLNDCNKKWWRYKDNIFMLWQHGEKELEKFLEFKIYRQLFTGSDKFSRCFSQEEK